MCFILKKNYRLNFSSRLNVQVKNGKHNDVVLNIRIFRMLSNSIIVKLATNDMKINSDQLTLFSNNSMILIFISTKANHIGHITGCISHTLG